MAEELEQEIERRVEALGYELVELERAGSKGRPILRVRIDRPGSTRGEGVTVDDCARVSRALEEWLDTDETVSDRYVLEVSSPGIERPLVRARDFERFIGREVAIKTHQKLSSGSKRVEGELIGFDAPGGEERVRLRLPDGSTIDSPRSNVARAHLVFRWEDRR
jgi:ribosome maturation factor RimP